MVKGGQLIDSTCVPAPRQHNTGEENRKIKDRVVPDWPEHKRRQKDTDANHTRKHGVYYYGYKNHVNADQGNKLIWSCAVTPASAADVTHLGDVLLPADVAEEVYADRGYHSRGTEELLAQGGHKSRIMCRAARNRPLGEAERARNRELSRVRARVEHVFGSMHGLGGNRVRCIGIVRAAALIGLQNLVYNMRRLVTLASLREKQV